MIIDPASQDTHQSEHHYSLRRIISCFTRYSTSNWIYSTWAGRSLSHLCHQVVLYPDTLLFVCLSCPLSISPWLLLPHISIEIEVEDWGWLIEIEMLYCIEVSLKLLFVPLCLQIGFSRQSVSGVHHWCLSLLYCTSWCTMWPALVWYWIHLTKWCTSTTELFP